MIIYLNWIEINIQKLMYEWCNIVEMQINKKRVLKMLMSRDFYKSRNQFKIKQIIQLPHKRLKNTKEGQLSHHYDTKPGFQHLTCDKYGPTEFSVIIFWEMWAICCQLLLNSHDSQASLVYSDRCLDGNWHSSTSVICNTNQVRQWLACPLFDVFYRFQYFCFQQRIVLTDMTKPQQLVAKHSSPLSKTHVLRN